MPCGCMAGLQKARVQCVAVPEATQSLHERARQTTPLGGEALSWPQIPSLFSSVTHPLMSSSAIEPEQKFPMESPCCGTVGKLMRSS